MSLSHPFSCILSEPWILTALTPGLPGAAGSLIVFSLISASQDDSAVSCSALCITEHRGGPPQVPQPRHSTELLLVQHSNASPSHSRSPAQKREVASRVPSEGLTRANFMVKILTKKKEYKDIFGGNGYADDSQPSGYCGPGNQLGSCHMQAGMSPLYSHPWKSPWYMNNAEASYDFSSNDPYPYPRYTDDWFNSHGTRCAGEVSAAANNNICGVGVAYGSKVAGIRMLDQPFMTDIIEASSISHMPQLIDIYSASWGPTDNGKTVDGPRELTLQAMADGVNKGRGGKGSIYVWASGDGGSYDDCNCDGYASSMWTISINSAINDGRTALYDESCSSTLASTFSNGRKRNPEAGVATTDLYGNCTLRHSGTSAAAPEAAGVFALALEANLGLTWRDMQHLTVLTSKRNQLHDEVHQWRRNGVGLEFNHLFGYGVLDAGAMVKMAKDWKTVPERFHCVGGSVQDPEKIPTTGKLVLTLTTDACEGKENFVRYLEHVQAVVTVNATRRGDLNINMTSPMGTKSILLSRRPRDDDAKVGFDKWPFMTTHTWGEDARGTWTLELGFVGSAPQKGVLKEWTLMLHGTQSAPYIDQVVRDYQSKLAMSKKEELEEELGEAVQRSLKSILGKD
ncbi:hypothetical protein FD754_011542 [Muntiacus muntjak]|uniref:Neuroendocrine convertase 2 n=1 Tax=Muntiacus muntjak TaxID=9888 RepID=A0A5N3VE34_MUNMU|nr:hypothetical protein FD754_011542 [Muntiacus muntjak]